MGTAAADNILILFLCHYYSLLLFILLLFLSLLFFIALVSINCILPSPTSLLEMSALLIRSYVLNLCNRTVLHPHIKFTFVKSNEKICFLQYSEMKMEILLIRLRIFTHSRNFYEREWLNSFEHFLFLKRTWTIRYQITQWICILSYTYIRKRKWQLVFGQPNNLKNNLYFKFNDTENESNTTIQTFANDIYRINQKLLK